MLKEALFGYIGTRSLNFGCSYIVIFSSKNLETSTDRISGLHVMIMGLVKCGLQSCMCYTVSIHDDVINHKSLLLIVALYK